MPTKTKIKNSRVRSSSKKTSQASSNLFKNFTLNKKSGLILVAVFAVLGAVFIFSASAATSSFEAEAANTSKTVVKGDGDATASGGKFIEFNSAEIITSSKQRFPGDPNPKVTGKAYWGAGIAGNGNPSRHESATGKSLSIRRTFWAMSLDPKKDKVASMLTTAKADVAANRLPHVSVKTFDGDWAGVAAGKYNAQIDDMLRKLDTLGGPVWFTAHHEPENDSKNPAEWRAMQKHFRDRMNVVGTKNIAFMPVLMSWTWETSKYGPKDRNPEDWWVAGIWDAYMVDPYSDKVGIGIIDSDGTGWKQFAAWSEKKGLPYGTAEWAIRTVEGGSWNRKVDHDPQQEAWTNQDCAESNLVLKPTTEAQEATAAALMRRTWEWGFVNDKDVIAHTYFDSCLNSRSGAWTLAKKQLETFQDILKNDQRVQRVGDLTKASTTTTASNLGTASATVSVPESGNYKLWVRMKVPDTTNNSVQAQIDDGAVIKVGDGGIAANTWTWVDWKGGDTKNLNNFTLNSGNHTVTLTGTEKGVKVDRVLITNENCNPKGFGDECATVTTTPPPTATPNISVSVPPQPVKGSVPISVTSDKTIKRVSFRPDNVWSATDESAPFAYNWDTTKYSNGVHSFVVRATIEGDSEAYREKTVTINVQNTTPPITSPTPPRDSEAPTTPQNLRANLNANWTRFAYEMNLSWTQSTDNVGVVEYQIARNSENLGSTKTNSYKDTKALKAGDTYTYSVTAVDAAGNRSRATTLTLKTKCTLIWCTASVL